MLGGRKKGAPNHAGHHDLRKDRRQFLGADQRGQEERISDLELRQFALVSGGIVKPPPH
jgi:hypothetical protein